jgi:hypothetical protein
MGSVSDDWNRFIFIIAAGGCSLKLSELNVCVASLAQTNHTLSSIVHLISSASTNFPVKDFIYENLAILN